MKRILFLPLAISLIFCTNFLNAAAPASLSLSGSAVTEISEPSDALPMKAAGNVFELYTSLKTGDYSFIGDESLAPQSITVDGTAPYRIRVDYSGEAPVVTTRKIEKVYMWAPWTQHTIVLLNYVGNSVFKAENVLCNKSNWGFKEGDNFQDTRYRFRMSLRNEAGEEILETYGPKSNGSFDLIGNGQWGAGNDYNYGINEGRYKNTGVAFTVEVFLKADGAYGHTITDYIDPDAPQLPESLAVQGTAVAESQEAISMKPVDKIFELYTSLQAGELSFAGDDGLATQTVSENGVYRIRADYSNNTPVVTLEKIQRVYLWTPWSKYTIAEAAYAGNSTFKAEKLFANDKQWGDDRYRIRIEFEEGRYETYASNNSMNLERATDGDWGTDSNGHPELSYKIAGRYRNTGIAFNVEIILKASGTYTHTVTEYINPDKPAALSIQGSALAETTDALPMKLTGNIFEAYTTLQTGEYRFMGSDELTGAQTIEVEEPAVYRIRVNYMEQTAPAVNVLKVKEVYMYAPRANKTIVNQFAYAGNSTFKASNIICENPVDWFTNDGGEDRYRIRIRMADESLETYAPKGGEEFVSVGNSQWAPSDYNYRLASPYRQDKKPFDVTVCLSATEGYSCTVSDHIGETTGINHATQTETNVWPTLVSGQVTVTSSVEGFAVELISVSGATVLKQESASKELTIDANGLANGIYLVKVSKAGTLIRLHKIVKR